MFFNTSLILGDSKIHVLCTEYFLQTQFWLTFQALMGALLKSKREKSGFVFPVNLNNDNQHMWSKTEQWYSRLLVLILWYCHIFKYLKISWMEEPGGLQSMGSLRVGHDWATSLSLFISCIWEGNGNPLQCSSLENPRDGGAWWAAVYGVAQSQTRLKWLSSSKYLINKQMTFPLNSGKI